MMCVRYHSLIFSIITATLLCPSLTAMEKQADANALCIAIKNNDKEQVLALIEAGADVNAPKNDEREPWIPLHYATYLERVEIAKLLVQHGAAIGAKDFRGMEPIRYTHASRTAKADELEEFFVFKMLSGLE